jgi:hypothetical protein
MDLTPGRALARPHPAQVIAKALAGYNQSRPSSQATECLEFRTFRARTRSFSTASTAMSLCTCTCAVIGSMHAKFWLAPVALAWNHGFSARELNEIRRIIIEHEAAIIGAWNEHCGQR